MYLENIFFASVSNWEAPYDFLFWITATVAFVMVTVLASLAGSLLVSHRARSTQNGWAWRSVLLGLFAGLLGIGVSLYFFRSGYHSALLVECKRSAISKVNFMEKVAQRHGQRHLHATYSPSSFHVFYTGKLEAAEAEQQIIEDLRLYFSEEDIRIIISTSNLEIAPSSQPE